MVGVVRRRRHRREQRLDERPEILGELGLRDADALERDGVVASALAKA
jgi:hypothetical protein